ncbi:MAG: DUF4332 domain-containing protein [Chromatiales bacterium]|nr:DUF4332 domain-containing protein [Chromatiales bacterium]
MGISIGQLKGMSRKIEATLLEMGVKDSDLLLERILSPGQRREMAKQIGISERNVLELANRADLSRIKGVAGIYSDLLEHVGVDTVKELAMRNADNLHAMIVELNRKKGFAKRAPSIGMVKSWVEQAKTLPKLLTY